MGCDVIGDIGKNSDIIWGDENHHDVVLKTIQVLFRPFGHNPVGVETANFLLSQGSAIAQPWAVVTAPLGLINPKGVFVNSPGLR